MADTHDDGRIDPVTARNIKTFREQLGMSQSQFAAGYGAPGSQSQVSQYERGKRRPTEQTLRRMILLGREHGVTARLTRSGTLVLGRQEAEGAEKGPLAGVLIDLAEMLAGGSEERELWIRRVDWAARRMLDLLPDDDDRAIWDAYITGTGIERAQVVDDDLVKWEASIHRYLRKRFRDLPPGEGSPGEQSPTAPPGDLEARADEELHHRREGGGGTSDDGEKTGGE